MLIRLLAIFLCIIISNSCWEKSEEKRYIRFMTDNSWGYKNEHGKIIIPPGRYDFLNPLNEYGMILAHKGSKKGYIDIQENVLIDFIYDKLGVFSQGLAPAKIKGRFGFIDRDGKVIIDFIYDDAFYFYRCGFAKVKLKNKWGFINTAGRVIIPIIYEEVDYNKTDNFIACKKGDKWAMFSGNGERLSGFDYDKVYETRTDEKTNTFFQNGLMMVEKDGEFGFLNNKMEEIIPCGLYSYAEPFNPFRLAIVEKQDKYGVIDDSGQFVIPAIYDRMEHPSVYSYVSMTFVAESESRYLIFKPDGTLLLEEKYSDFYFSRIRIKNEFQDCYNLKNLNNKYGVVGVDGEILIPFDYEQIDLFEGDSLTKARLKDKYGVINSKNYPVFPFEYDNISLEKHCNYIILVKDGSYGVADREGEIIIPFEYTSINPSAHNRNNIFLVKKSNGYGLLSIQNELITSDYYDYISNWVEYGPEGTHFIVENGKKGLLSKDGEELVKPIYEKLYYLSSDIIIVSKEEKEGIININGKIILEIKYDRIYPDVYEILFDGITPTNIYVKLNGDFLLLDLKGRVIEKNISKTFIKDTFESLPYESRGIDVDLLMNKIVF